MGGKNRSNRGGRRWKTKKKQQQQRIIPRSQPGISWNRYRKLLVLGDGDFSFSYSLAKHHLFRDERKEDRSDSPSEAQQKKISAVFTSFDSEDEVKSKYPETAPKCLKHLSQFSNVTLKFDVDATNLSKTLGNDSVPADRVVTEGFDCIVFNFPHTGLQRVHENVALITDFLDSAKSQLREKGEILVTYLDSPPYSRWNIPLIASSRGLLCLRTVTFEWSDYPEYHHSTTDPIAKQLDVEDGPCITKVFSPPTQAQLRAYRAKMGISSPSSSSSARENQNPSSSASSSSASSRQRSKKRKRQQSAAAAAEHEAAKGRMDDDPSEQQQQQQREVKKLRKSKKKHHRKRKKQE